MGTIRSLLIAIAKAQREGMRELAQQADEAGMTDVAKYRRSLVCELDGVILAAEADGADVDGQRDQHSAEPRRTDWAADRGLGGLRPTPPAPRPEPIQKGGIPFPGGA